MGNTVGRDNEHLERETFEAMLTGGHPNSLRRTIEVVDLVIADRARLQELVHCYRSDNETVRLRTSNALCRVEEIEHEWLIPHLDELINDVGNLDQASAQWTLAKLFFRYTNDLSKTQKDEALLILKRNIEHNDWIVLIKTLETLVAWAKDATAFGTTPELTLWLRPHVDRLIADSRKSVARNAEKQRNVLYGTSVTG
jgi:hypothetical protein